MTYLFKNIFEWFYKSKLYAFILIFYAYLCWLMLEITLQYIPIKLDVAFLAIKQDYIHLLHYRIAFFIHVFSSIFVLLAGFTQFSKYIRKKYSSIHRKIGWLYITFILLFSAPSGLIIGFYANGGFFSQLAFCMLAIIWFVCTYMATTSIAKCQIISHEIWMIRSFSLTLSALTLRAWKYIIVALFQPRPMDVYQIVAWLGWVLNLVIAEIIIFKKYEKKYFI